MDSNKNNPNLKENYAKVRNKKKKRKIQYMADGGMVDSDATQPTSPDQYVMSGSTTPGSLDPSQPPQQFLGQILDKAVGDQKPQGDEIVPTTSPLDLIPYDKAALSVADAIASGLKSDEFRSIVGNEIGAIGHNVKEAVSGVADDAYNAAPGAIQKLQAKLGVSTSTPLYNDKVEAAKALLAQAEQNFANGNGASKDVAFALQKLQSAQRVNRKNFADGGEVESPDFISDNDMQGYADGGEIPNNGMPQEAQKPILSNNQQQPPQFISDAQVQQLAPESNVNSAPAPQFISDADYDDKHGRFESTGQQVITGLEGAAKGVLGPLAPLAERAVGVKPEDIRAREEANPGISSGSEAAGFLGSLFTGTGEAGLIAKAGGALTKGLEAGNTASKIAGAGLRAAAETALLQSGDEISKMIVQDPTQSLQTAVAHVGLAGLLGGAGGTVLGAIHPLWRVSGGKLLGPVIADFKGTLNNAITNPDTVTAVTDELADHYKNIKSMADDVYGAEGLKAQDIAKVMPELNDKIINHSAEVAQTGQDLVNKMLDKPNSYPARLVAKLQDDVSNYQAAIANPEATSGDLFNATQELKQAAQSYAKYDKFVKPVDEAYDFVKDAKGLAYDLRTSLENSSVWGKAAERQQAINDAFSKFQPALKDFEKKFTSEVMGDRVVDPGKINTYINQLGKPSAEIKQSNLRNFLDASDKYTKVINDTHTNLGIEQPLTPTSLASTRQTLDEITPGMKLAKIFIEKGLTDAGGKAIGGTIGAALGHASGAGGGIGAFIGAHTLGPFFSSVLPAIAKPLLKTEVNAQGMKAATDYALAISKGEDLLDKTSAGVFSTGKDALPKDMHPTEESRERLDKVVGSITNNPSPLEKANPISHYLPDHGIALASTAANAIAYLNSLRPNEQRNGPLDSPMVPSAVDKAKFTQALNIAQQPLTVLDKIKKGTLTSDDIHSLTSMYPALAAKMQTKLVADMTKAVSQGTLIPYKTRIGMSMFLGQPMDSSFSSASIRAAQPQGNAAQNPAPSPDRVKRNTSSLGKNNELYMTPLQSLASAKLKH